MNGIRNTYLYVCGSQRLLDIRRIYTSAGLKRLNQLNVGLLRFCYELWVKTTSVCIDKFSVIVVWKLVVWILSAFSGCLRVSEHELGAKFVVVLKRKLNVTKIYLGHWFSVAFVVNFCVCVVEMWWVSLLCRYLATRVGWPNWGVPALSEPDFGVLLGHYYVIWYCICEILLNSKHLSQFCLVIYFEFLTALLVLYHYDNYLTTISVSAQPIHQMIFWIWHV